mmetsp:Transcript_5709/g.19973  ORF Transcript_5709/g.19973 Transcript_5709/m.19973 type:complete len:98 (-) Transcript_5709:1489-1782(-)
MRLFEAVRRVVARVRSSGGVKRAGVLTGLADGNYGHTMLRSGSIGKFVGQDALGNKYYEAYEGIASPVQTGAHRSRRTTRRPQRRSDENAHVTDARS